jgi:hypothetical protein
MKIDTTHEQYDDWLPIWTKCRDAIEGQEQVHKGGVKYLPKLSGQTQTEYNSYVMRSLYFNASGRTLDGMTGLIFRKKPTIIAPASMEAILDDVDMCGSDMMAFAEQLAEELIKVSRIGILVDYPPNSTEGLTVGNVQALGLRPYATLYKTETILDWRYKRVGNVEHLSMVKLKETSDEQISEFEYEKKDQIRVLDLFEGVYRVRVYVKGKRDYEQISESFPKMNGQSITKIPFIFCSINGIDSDVKKPVLLDLVNVNLSHYRSMADYEHGLHFTGLPTPIFWGANFDDEGKFKLGSSEGMAFNNPAGHAEYLEFTGQGLSALKAALEDKQAMMAQLGSKMLTAEKRVVEAAETAAIHRSAENSILSSISYAGSSALTKMLEWLAMWANANGDVSVELNTDFLPTQMNPQMFAELTKAYMTGALSFEEYFANLKDGEIIRSETTEEEERERLQSAEPVLSEM